MRGFFYANSAGHMEIIPEIERLNREVERLMEAQKEREIEQKLMAQMEEKEKERRQFYLEIIKAFIAPVVTAVVILWLTK